MRDVRATAVSVASALAFLFIMVMVVMILTGKASAAPAYDVNAGQTVPAAVQTSAVR